MARKLRLWEVLDKEIVKFLRKKSSRRSRVSCDRGTSFMGRLEKTSIELEAEFLKFLAIHLLNSFLGSLRLPILNITKATRLVALLD